MDKAQLGHTIGGDDSALYIVDEHKRILFMNDAASLLIAKDPDLVEGSPCWEVMGLRTMDGEPFCDQDCPLWQHARAGTLDEEIHLTCRSPTGSMSEISLRPLLLSVPGQQKAALLHVIKPLVSSIDLQPSETGTVTAQDNPGPLRGQLRHNLTDRETEVLQLLTVGNSTRDIADTLCISPVTVRNHLQNVMRKFDVHRRLDAVVAWMAGSRRS